MQSGQLAYNMGDLEGSSDNKGRQWENMEWESPR